MLEGIVACLQYISVHLCSNPFLVTSDVNIEFFDNPDIES